MSESEAAPQNGGILREWLKEAKRRPMTGPRQKKNGLKGLRVNIKQFFVPDSNLKSELQSELNWKS